jgi:ADP-heptose:LPS heptosyltransferase
MTPARRLRRRALLCLLPGLGDALTASSIVRRLRAADIDVDVMAMLPPVAEYARALTEIREVHLLPMLTRPWACVSQLVGLRLRRYDLCIVPFPATRWQYALVALVVGARKTVIHKYGGAASMLSSAMRAVQVALLGGHRMSENNRIANALELPSDPGNGYLVPDEWRSPHRTKGLLGVHTGTMIYKGNEARRWPFDRFVEVIRRQVREPGRRVRVFVGPNEADDERRLRGDLADVDVEIVKDSLESAALKLSECEVFVGNDAGLGHIASGLAVKTLVIFGMTDPVRALPVGSAVALRPSSCPPCHDEGMRSFSCVRSIGFRCLVEDITVKRVNDELNKLFAMDHVANATADFSRFAMYGHEHRSDV